MRKVSIRIQIMLWYTLLTAILLAVSLPVLYGAMAGSLRRDQEAYLRSAAGQLASHIEWEDGDLKLLNDLDLPAGTQYLLTTESGGRVVSSENAWAGAPSFRPDEVYLASNGNGDQLYLDQELELEGGEKIRIRVSRSNGTVERSLDQLQLVMLLAVPAFLALAVFGSYFLAKLALRPIDRGWRGPLTGCWPAWRTPSSGRSSSPRTPPMSCAPRSPSSWPMRKTWPPMPPTGRRWSRHPPF